MRTKTLAITMMLPLLFGCGSQPQRPRYAAPAGVVTADLRSDINGAFGRNDSIDIYATNGPCGVYADEKLFDVHKSKSRPDGVIKVAANQPLHLQYYESIAGAGGRSCQLSLEVSLEEGKSYSLVGGFEYKSGPIPIFTDTRMCRLGVQDDATKLYVPVKQCK